VKTRGRFRALGHALARAVILALLISAALVLIGGFPLRQGASLGLLLAAADAILSSRLALPQEDPPLTPYWVGISPKWCQILSDYKLISGPEEWQGVLELAKGLPDYRVLRDGVLFTVIQRQLVYWNQHQGFGSEFRTSESKYFTVNHREI
jgi:hypothetical protein